MTYRARALALLAKYVAPLPTEIHGVDLFLPLLERMRVEGAVFLLKLDGERTGPDDAGPYTVAVSQGRCREPIRMDADHLEDALAYAVVTYFEGPEEDEA